MLFREESQSLDTTLKQKTSVRHRPNWGFFMLNSVDRSRCLFMCSKVIDVGAAHKRFNDLSACRWDRF